MSTATSALNHFLYCIYLDSISPQWLKDTVLNCKVDAGIKPFDLFERFSNVIHDELVTVGGKIFLPGSLSKNERRFLALIAKYHDHDFHFVDERGNDLNHEEDISTIN